MMELYFDEEKCKKIDKGVYLGTKDDFVAFSKANKNLPRTKWFRQIIDKMYWKVEGLAPAYREDCMQSYYNSMRKCGLLNENTM